MGGPKQGYLTSMTQEPDYYTAHEVARLLGISPARVRQMLRAGELEGERGPALPEGVPGPWRVPAGAVSAYGEGRNALAAADADETVALPPQEIAPSTPRDAPGVSSPEGLPPEEAPSETSERLSEGVGALRDKAEEIIEELNLLESRLEAAEIEHIAVRDAAGREKSTVWFEWVRLPPEPRRFRGPLPRRWVAERTIGWLVQSRRMSKDYERLCQSSQAMIYAVMSRLMLRRLTRA